MYGYVRLWRAMHGYEWHGTAMQGYVRLYMKGYLGIMYGYALLCKAMHGYARICTAMFGYERHGTAV